MISPDAIDRTVAGSGTSYLLEILKNKERSEVAIWNGWQEDGEGGGFDLWTLKEAIPGHPAGSTVVEATLDAAIFPKEHA